MDVSPAKFVQMVILLDWPNFTTKPNLISNDLNMNDLIFRFLAISSEAR